MVFKIKELFTYRGCPSSLILESSLSPQKFILFCRCRNYNAELVAFQARLGENFDESKLRDAFISLDYFEVEKQRQRDLEITTDFCSNIQLAESGRQVIEESLRGYLRWAMPYLPEEGVDAFTHFLMQKKLLAHVSFHIGTMDLILSEVVCDIFWPFFLQSDLHILPDLFQSQVEKCVELAFLPDPDGNHPCYWCIAA